MKIAVLGASGFIGRHLVQKLIAQDHEVIAVDVSDPPIDHWKGSARLVRANLYEPFDAKQIAGESEAIIDLVWPGLPNYMEMFHFEINTFKSFSMLKTFVDAGYRHILSVGTCLEYGLQSGPLDANMATRPDNPYAFAKDTLRQSLKMLAEKNDLIFQWARLFYVYGEGQNPKSLLPSLETAIKNGESTFNMSGGEQLRDFIAIDEAVSQLARLVENNTLTGEFNICSGLPTSVRRLIEEKVACLKSDIQLNFGHYPYPHYEPMAFWGIPHAELKG